MYRHVCIWVLYMCVYIKTLALLYLHTVNSAYTGRSKNFN